jgi:lipoic acid synthetase
MNTEHRTLNTASPTSFAKASEVERLRSASTEHRKGGSRKPDWLKVKLGGGPNYSRLEKLMKEQGLHTVCDEALCPNKGKCWENNHATFMILGEKCTRGCAFCNVTPQRPDKYDKDEPKRVAEAVRTLGLKNVVITSVTRDDLDDGGAAIWSETIERVRAAVPGAMIEVLVPDFGGSDRSLDKVLAAKPDVFGHNLETVPSLYKKVRSRADYKRSLGILRKSHAVGLITKTAIMLGMGEASDEVAVAMRDALIAGCDILYIGQYLQPTKKHLPVHRYVEPAEFDEYRAKGLKMGFNVVVSAPLVRSSYHSDEQTAFVAKTILNLGARTSSSAS